MDTLKVRQSTSTIRESLGMAAILLKMVVGNSRDRMRCPAQMGDTDCVDICGILVFR